MRMLDDLQGILGEIEQESDWEHRFVQDMMIIKEEGKTLSKKQFSTLSNIHQKYMRKSRSLG